MLLAVSVVLRLAGPVGGLPSRDGFVAICTGGEIVYIPVAQTGIDSQPEDDSAPTSERCPWYYQFHAVLGGPELGDFLSVPLSSVPAPVRRSAVSSQQKPLSFQARAPPRSQARDISQT